MKSLSLNEPLLVQWLTQSLSVPNTLFTSVDVCPDLLSRPLQESKGTLGLFLKEAVDPYRGVPGVQWMVHAAEPGGIDLLKSEYSAAGLRLVVTESTNFVVVETSSLGGEALNSKNSHTYLADLINTVVKADSANHHWQFQIPQDLSTSQGSRLISNTGAVPLKALQSRHDRADILLWDDSVYFIFYKKREQLEDFLPADKWFSAEARAAIKSRIKRP